MEYIYYVDEHDNPTGEIEEKYAAHHANTKLHAAFSCYVFSTDGKLLITRRAGSKKVWPGVWTNSFCGHPLPNESRIDALARRATYELGMSVSDVTLIVPDYIYKTPAYKGIIEHEYCPIYFATAASEPSPNPDEVSDLYWQSITDIDSFSSLLNDNREWSWWIKDQITTILNTNPYRQAAETYLNSYVLAGTQLNQPEN